jgi:hypothetical protein
MCVKHRNVTQTQQYQSLLMNKEKLVHFNVTSSLISNGFSRRNFLLRAKFVQLLRVPCGKPSELGEDPVCQDRTSLQEHIVPPSNAWPQHFHPVRPNVQVCTPTHLGNSRPLVPTSQLKLLYHKLHWNNQHRLDVTLLLLVWKRFCSACFTRKNKSPHGMT